MKFLNYVGYETVKNNPEEDKKCDCLVLFLTPARIAPY